MTVQSLKESVGISLSHGPVSTDEILHTSYCIIELVRRRSRKMFRRESNWRGWSVIIKDLFVTVRGLITIPALFLELTREVEVETMMIRMTRGVEGVMTTLVRLAGEGLFASNLLASNCCL